MDAELQAFARKHLPTIELAPLPEPQAALTTPIPVLPKPQDGPRKICVALLAYDAKMYCRTFMSLAQTMGQCMEKGWGFTYVLREGDSMVARGRSLLASQFLTHEGLADCTDLVFVDGDIFWDGDELMRLLTHDADVVAAAYPFKNEGGNFPIRWPSHGLFEQNGMWVVQATTAGFMRIRRQALQRMVVEMPWLAVHDHDAGSDEKMWMFFDNLARQNGVYDESFTFCERWRGAGGTVYVDPTITLNHIGIKIYNHGNLIHWMDRIQKKCVEILEKHPHLSKFTTFRAAIGVKNLDLEKEEADAIAAGAPLTDVAELAAPADVK